MPSAGAIASHIAELGEEAVETLLITIGVAALAAACVYLFVIEPRSSYHN